MLWWRSQTEKAVSKDKAPGKVASSQDLGRQNIIAVAAREQRKRDDKEEPQSNAPAAPDSKQQQQSQQSQQQGQSTQLSQQQPQQSGRPLLSQTRPSGLILTAAQRRHFEGESTGPINLRPLIRLQINRTTMALELDPDGDVQVDASIDSIQFLDLSMCSATDPWTSVVHPLEERVEFGYIGPIVPQGQRTKGMTQSVVVDVSKPNTVTHLAPPSMPVGVIIRLRRSKDAMNSDQRNQHLQSKAKDKDSSTKVQSPTASTQKKDRSVTDILFGTDPGDDKDASAAGEKDGGGAVPHKQISPAIMFSHSVAVRTSTDLQVNNLRLSFTDSLVEIPDFIRAPPAPYSDRQKERMEKGDDVSTLDSAQAESDKQQEQLGGETKRSNDAIRPMADPSVNQQHMEDIQQTKKEPVRGVISPESDKEADKKDAKNKADRLEKEKEAIEDSVKVVPMHGRNAQQQGQQQSSAGNAGTEVEASATHATVGDTKEDVVAKKPESSLAFLSFFSPMLVRIHAPSPYISLIPDTAARQLQRLTFSLNANARALLDGEADSIHARADITNVRAWVARTEPVQAISLAPFHPPMQDSNYIIRPFNIGASFERFPSPLQQALGKAGTSGQGPPVRIEEEFSKEVGDQAELDEEDITTVFEGDKAVYHMDADVDISAIHLKLAAKMWYMLQPFITRVKKTMDKFDV